MAINVASLYRWSLLLPILLPVISFSLIAQGLLAEWATWPARWLLGSGYVGGVPYVLVLVLTRSRVRHLDKEGMERYLWRLPPLTALITVVCWVLVAVFGPGRGADNFEWRGGSDIYGFSIILITLTLAFGYSYVLLVRGCVGMIVWLQGRAA